MNSASGCSFLDEKRVLVTGAAGTIGSLLIESLLQTDTTVCAFDSDEAGLAELNLGAHMVKREISWVFVGNTRDLARLDEVYSGVDYLFHCAAMKHADIANTILSKAKTNIEG